MTLEHVAMAIVVVAVAVVAFLLGRARGVQLGEDEIDPNDPSLFGAQKNMSLFGPRVPVQPTERQLIAVMPEALIVVDSLASVKYVSPGAQRFGIVEDHAMTLVEIRDILRLVSTDSVVRERELSIPLDRAARAAAKNTDGKGIEAGKFRPSDTLYLHVRVGQISDDLFAIFISNMSEQRRFEIMRRDFVTNVSHELKTPAGAISLLAETIGDAADDPDMVKYFAGRVSKESERLTELVHRLIDLQKAQSAAAVLNAERLSVLALVREAIVENQVNAESKHISIVLSLNGKQKLVYVEGTENAIDQDDVFINVDVGSSDGKVSIRVVDQGIGIPESSLDRIFERFYRVDPARSRETGGTGLGLAITKHCVQDCGGTIAVWSREGEGSTFTITLTQAESEQDEESAKSETEEISESEQLPIE